MTTVLMLDYGEVEQRLVAQGITVERINVKSNSLLAAAAAAMLGSAIPHSVWDMPNLSAQLAGPPTGGKGKGKSPRGKSTHKQNARKAKK